MHRKRNEYAKKALCLLFSLVFVLGGWQVTSLILATPALPAPAETLSICLRYGKDLAPDFAISLQRIGISLLLGTLLGTPVGLLLGRCAKLDQLFAPALYLLYPIPKIVLLPILLVLLGFGSALKIALITLTVLFQVIVVMRDAAKNIPDDALISVRSLGATRIQLAFHVIFPATLPHLFTTLRISSSVAIAVLFFAESIAGSTGLGYFIMNSWGMVNYPRMFAGIVALAFLGVLFYESFDLVEKHFMHTNHPVAKEW